MSSFYDKSSLVLIPSGTKTSKVYSQKPTNGDGDFDFTRSTAATRVNADGNIEKEKSNLLLQSNQFDTTWITPDSTITGGQSGYDGTNNAWLLTATNAFHRVVQSVSQSGVKRFSVYAKANTNDYLLLGSVEGAHYYATFNLATGAVDSNNINAISPSIENVGNGWYRCSATWVGTTTDVRIASQTTGGQSGWASTTSGSIYIQDAQLNQGLIAQEVITTTTTALYGGITDNVPRLDYTDSSCPALLLEPQRFNAIDSSEYAGAWSAIDSNITKTDNATTSPEGVNNAVKLEGLTGSASNQIVNFGTTLLDGVNVVGKTYTASVYIKPVNPSDVGDDIYLSIQRSNGDYEGLNVTFEITSADWKRYDLTYTFTGAGAGDQVGAVLKILRNSTTIDDIYIWGAQLEEGSHPTSYIPTYGTSVTRSNDETDVTGLQSKGILSSTEGTMFFHITDIQGTAVVFNAQTANNLSYALRFVIRDIGFTIYQRVNNVQTTIRANNSLALSEWKIAMSWNGTNLITSLNGTSYIDTIDASISSQLDKIARVNPQAISVTTNQILVFPTQLTEAELNDLTTI